MAKLGFLAKLGSKLWKGTKSVGKGFWKGTKSVGKGLWKGTKSIGKGLLYGSSLMPDGSDPSDQEDSQNILSGTSSGGSGFNSATESSSGIDSKSESSLDLDIELSKSKGEVKAESSTVKSISSIVSESESKVKESNKLTNKYGIDLKPSSIKSSDIKPEVKPKSTEPQTNKVQLNIVNESKNIHRLVAIENLLKAQLESQSIANELAQNGNEIELEKLEGDKKKTELIKAELDKLNSKLGSANNLDLSKRSGGSNDIKVTSTTSNPMGDTSMPMGIETESESSESGDGSGSGGGILDMLANALPFINFPGSKKAATKAVAKSATKAAATKAAGKKVAKEATKKATKSAAKKATAKAATKAAAKSPGFWSSAWSKAKSVGKSAYDKVAKVVSGKLMAGVKTVVSKACKLLGPKIGPKIAQIITKLGTTIAKFAGTAAKATGKMAGKAVPGLGLILGIGDAIYRGFKQGDWLGALLSAVAGIASTFPGLGGAVAIAIESINLVRDIYKANKDEVADLLKEAQDNGWATNDPSNPYRILMSKYGDNPSESQKKELINNLKKLNDLMKRKSKMKAKDFNAEYNRQLAEIKNLNSSSSSKSTSTNTSARPNNQSNIQVPYSPLRPVEAPINTTSFTTFPSTWGSLVKGDANGVVAEARRFEGRIPYSQSGPRNPYKGSADCSSFVSHVYKATTGIDPGYNTNDQLNNNKGTIVDQGSVNQDGTGGGKGPDISKLKPGDLLFERRDSSANAGRPYKVGHVSMYVGDGKVLSQGGYKGKPGPYEVNITTPNYAKNYIAAKRYLTDKLSTNVSAQEVDTQSQQKTDKSKGTEADTTVSVNTKSEAPIVVNAPVTKTYNKTTNNYIRSNNALNAELN